LNTAFIRLTGIQPRESARRRKCNQKRILEKAKDAMPAADCIWTSRELIGRRSCRVSKFRKYSFHFLSLAAFLHSSILVKNKTKERWLELCEQAAVEQDRVKVLELAKEINRLLQEKENHLAKLHSAKDSFNP
jgi:hypothetical protein